MADNRQSIEAGRGHVTLATNDAPLRAGLKAAEKTFKAWGQTITTIGAAITASSAAIMAPFLHGLNVASDWQRETQAGMRETGLSFREFDTLTDGMRVSAEELVPAIAHMSAYIVEAANGSHEANRNLEMMGLSIEGLIDASQGERAFMIADGINSIADASQRVALQRSIFGRGALAMNITGGRSGIQGRAERVDVLEGEAVNLESNLAIIKRYTEAMREMRIVSAAIWTQLGIYIAPFMSGLVTQITRALIAVRQWMDENRGLVTIIFYVGAALAVVGTAITLIGSIVWVTGAAFGAFASVLAFVGRAVTSVGGALALVQYGSMIVGLGAVSAVALLARIALYSYKAAVLLITAAQWAYNFALGVYEGVMLAAQGVTISFIATTAAGRGGLIGYTAAVYAAAAAAWVYHAAVWALTTGFGVLTVAQGIAAIGAASWAWLMSTSFVTEAIRTIGIWAMNAALIAVSAIYNFLTVSLWAYSAAEIFAWIWEVALTQGAALLTFTLQFLFGTLVIVTGALAVLGALFAGAAVGLNLLGVRFGELHESLTWIDTMGDAIIGFFRDLPDYIAAAWHYLVASPVVAFVHLVIDAFNWLRDSIAQVWSGIDNILGNADSEGLGEMLAVFGYAAVGLAIFLPLFGYVIYEMDVFGQLVELVTSAIYALPGLLMEIGAAIVDYVLAPFRMLAALFDEVVGWVDQLVARIVAPFVRLRDWIVGVFTSALVWVQARLEAFGAWIAAKIDALLAPFRELRDRIVGYWQQILAWAQNQFAGIVIVTRLVYAQIVALYGRIRDKIEEFLQAALEVIVALARIFLPLWLQLLIAVIFFRDQVIEVIEELIQKVKDYFVELVNSIAALFSGRLLRLLEAVWAGILGAAGAVVDKLRDLFGELIGKILQPFRDLWAIVLASVVRVLGYLRVPFDALVGFLNEAWDRIKTLLGQLWDSIVNTGRQAVASFLVVMGTLRDVAVGIWQAFAGGFLAAIGRMVDAARSAGQSIWATLTGVFGTLRNDIVRIWEGIRRAFNAGDWDLIWQIVKAGAVVAWLEIKVAGLQVWADLKAGAVGVFNEIGDYLGDAFDDAWVAIRRGWNTLVGEMKAVWHLFMAEARASAYEVAAANPLQSAANRAQWQSLARSARSGGSVDAFQSRQRAEIDNMNLGRTAGGDWANNQAARVQRDMQLDAARIAEQVAAQTGNAGALAAARARLNELLARAQTLPASPPFAGEGFNRRVQESVFGTFSSQAAFGMLGAGFAESPAARQARLIAEQLQEARQLHADVVRLLNEVVRVAGARFS